VPSRSLLAFKSVHLGSLLVLKSNPGSGLWRNRSVYLSKSELLRLLQSKLLLRSELLL
jgi:hypothetical protein